MDGYDADAEGPAALAKPGPEPTCAGRAGKGQPGAPSPAPPTCHAAVAASGLEQIYYGSGQHLNSACRLQKARRRHVSVAATLAVASITIGNIAVLLLCISSTWPIPRVGPRPPAGGTLVSTISTRMASPLSGYRPEASPPPAAQPTATPLARRAPRRPASPSSAVRADRSARLCSARCVAGSRPCCLSIPDPSSPGLRPRRPAQRCSRAVGC